MAAPEEGVREPDMGSAGQPEHRARASAATHGISLHHAGERLPALSYDGRRKLCWSLGSGSKCVWSGRLECGVEQMEGAEYVDSNVHLQWKCERGRRSSEEGTFLKWDRFPATEHAAVGNYAVGDHKSKVIVCRPHVEGAVTIGLTSTYA